MNWTAFLFFTAVSFAADFLADRHSSPGAKIGATIYTILGGVFIGVITPQGAGWWHYTGLFIALTGRVSGGYLGRLADHVRLYLDNRQHAKSAKT